MRIHLAVGLAILSATLASADDGRIWLKNTEIDGKSVRMFFDSGSSGLCLTSQAVKRLGLKIVVPPTNSFGETADYSADFNGQQFHSPFYVIDIPYVIPNFDGLMGWGPMRSNIFRIDAAAQRLTFLSEAPGGVKRWTQLSIETNAEALDLEVPAERRGQKVIFVDTGDPRGISLTTREWKRWKKAHPRNPITLEVIGTVDGAYVCEESWADQIQIGPLTLYDVPVMQGNRSTVKQRGSERDVLGFAALRRLDLVVDGIHGVAYLRAKQTPPTPYSYNRLGAVFVPTVKDPNHLVARVLTGSPAYDAGIRNGDIVLKIDGQSIGDWTNGVQEGGPDHYSMPAGTRLDLTLQRRRKIFEATPTLREILQPSDRKYEATDDFPGLSELDAEGYFDQGFECERQGDSNGALTNYDKAIERNPEFGEAYGRRALLEQETNEFDAAIADNERALQLAAPIPEIKANLAQLYVYRGGLDEQSNQLDAALANFNKGITLDPDLAVAYAHRGYLEECTNEYDAAIADYEKVLQLKVAIPDVKTNLAQIYVCRGYQEEQSNQLDAVITDYEKALQLNGASPGIRTNLALIYVCRGYLDEQSNRLDAALADFSKGIELEPGLAEGYSYRVWPEQKQGNLDGAEADSFEAVKLDSSLSTNAAEQLWDLGSIRYERHELTNALADFHQACEFRPIDDYAHFGVWLCSSSLGNSERATEELKAYLSARGPKDSGDWPLEVGRFLAGQKTEQDLLSAAKSAEDKKDKEQHCEAYFYIGAKHLIAGDKTGAAAEFRKCLATDVKDFDEYRFAKADLQMLGAGS